MAYEAAITFLAGKRTELGISQRELAARLNKHRSFVTKIEARERRLDIVEFVALARALGIEPSSLLEELTRTLPSELDF